MSENENEDAPQDPQVPEAEVRKRRGISMVWIVPIIAAIVAGGLWLQSIQSRGPVVTVIFDDGSSLEAGKTKVLFEGVEVGRMQSVELAADLKSVETTIQLDESAQKMALEGAEYWVVRPSIGIGGISGLETLVSGSYVGVIPGKGEKKKRFVAVGQPPMATTRIPGLQLTLSSSGLASLEVGSPIAFRQIQVGEVTGYQLREDRSGVELTAVIYERHQHLVRENSKFWNASGIKVTLGAAGLEVETQSLAALLLGGISFTTPKGDRAGGEVKDGSPFELFTDFDSVKRERRIQNGLVVILESASAGSVKRGDPVSYREVKVGEVLRQKLGSESSKVLVYVNIWPKYAALVRDNSVFWNASGIKAHFGLFSGLDLSMESLESLIAGGIAFATPDDPGARVANNSYFKIAEKPEDRWLNWAPRIKTAASAVLKAPVRVLEGDRKDEGEAANAPQANAEQSEQGSEEGEVQRVDRERATAARRNQGGPRPGHGGF
jgi:paraquat-inducible protein B